MLHSVASQGIVAIGIYVDWTVCQSVTCSVSDPSLPYCAIAMEQNMTKTVEFVQAGSLDAYISNTLSKDPSSPLHGLNVTVDGSRIALGGHSGAGWSVMASAANMSTAMQEAIKSIVLVHPAVKPIASIDDQIAWEDLHTLEHAKLMTICGKMCEYTCDSCLFEAFEDLSFCNQDESECGDCEAKASCEYSTDYVTQFQQYANGTDNNAMAVSGPWWHTAIENWGSSGRTVHTSTATCGAVNTNIPTAESLYLVGWLKYALLAEINTASAVTGSANTNGEAAVRYLNCEASTTHTLVNTSSASSVSRVYNASDTSFTAEFGTETCGKILRAPVDFSLYGNWGSVRLDCASMAPTTSPTDSPTTSPTDAPTDAPTGTPTVAPTGVPTDTPTGAPTTGAPTGAPTTTDAPTSAPTGAPTAVPTDAPTTTDAPTSAPTHAPR